jgi:predicted HTH transcriptional regulator
MLTAREISELLASGYELRAVELKGPGARTEQQLLMKVIRASLSMGNLRDGGYVIVGIDDNDPAALQPGLNATDLKSWLAYDDLARKMNEYADPPLRFDVAEVQLRPEVAVAVIRVYEFADIPHLCAKDYPGVLRKGALYVRPRKVPETSEVASSVEMRDVLHLATEKALRAYVETAVRAGVSLSGSTEQFVSDDARFEKQLSVAWK